jgi:cytochrome c
MFPVRYLALAAPIIACVSLLSVSAAPAQNANGATLFKNRCAACHAVAAGEKSGIGPNLRGVIGRKAGTVTYSYSPAMKKSGLVWSKISLDKFLTGPAKAMPGTKMAIGISDAAQRKAIIDYLATQR